MNSPVWSDHCEQIIRLPEPKCDINIPALSRLKGSDIPLQPNAGIVVIGFIIVVQLPVVGVFPDNIIVVIDAVTIRFFVSCKTVLKPVLVFDPNEVGPCIIPANVIARISRRYVEIDDFKETDVFQRLCRDVRQLVTNLKISSVFRSDLYFSFNFNLLVHANDATVVRVVFLPSEFFHDAVFAKVFPVMN